MYVFKCELRKNTKYAIVYLDMLGTTAKIQSSDDEFYLNHLHQIYDRVIQMTSEDSSYPSNMYKKIRVKIFSDNIIFAKELRKTPINMKEDIEILLDFVSMFICEAVTEHWWLVRGGMTIGEAYIDKDMVWGKGLIRAYELENRVANYPRVIIDKEVYELFSNTNDRYFSIDHSDDSIILEYLNYYNGVIFQGETINNKLNKSYDKMVNDARRPDGTYDDKVFQKLQWHKNYINDWLNNKQGTR